MSACLNYFSNPTSAGLTSTGGMFKA